MVSWAKSPGFVGFSCSLGCLPRKACKRDGLRGAGAGKQRFRAGDAGSAAGTGVARVKSTQAELLNVGRGGATAEDG